MLVSILKPSKHVFRGGGAGAGDWENKDYSSSKCFEMI